MRPRVRFFAKPLPEVLVAVVEDCRPEREDSVGMGYSSATRQRYAVADLRTPRVERERGAGPVTALRPRPEAAATERLPHSAPYRVAAPCSDHQVPLTVSIRQGLAHADSTAVKHHVGSCERARERPSAGAGAFRSMARERLLAFWPRNTGGSPCGCPARI